MLSDLAHSPRLDSRETALANASWPKDLAQMRLTPSAPLLAHFKPLPAPLARRQRPPGPCAPPPPCYTWTMALDSTPRRRALET